MLWLPPCVRYLKASVFLFDKEDWGFFMICSLILFWLILFPLPYKVLLAVTSFYPRILQKLGFLLG